jgi:two-component sensor histidine kinase
LPNFFEATAPLRAHPWFGHAFGMTGLLLALWLRFAIGDGLVGYPFITFVPVVVLTAFLGGTAAGALCGVFSGLAAWYFFVAPENSFALEWPVGYIAMGFYAFSVGLNLCLIHVMVRALERLQTARARADRLVERQRTMFAELQHRVANNMQFVSSLLSLQKRRVEDDPASAPAVLDDAVERLRTMARVHRRLYDPAASTVSFGEHLREICTDLLDATGARNVACRVEAPPTDLPVETLITLSLIATEAVTNSLKHAWPKGEGGTIRIALERPEPGRVALSVSDDGRGPPAGYDVAKGGDSLGLRIIGGLVQQLGGELSVGGEGGTTTRVEFAA